MYKTLLNHQQIIFLSNVATSGGLGLVAILESFNNNMHYFAQEAAELLKEGIDLITDADAALCKLLSYPLHDTLSRSAKHFNVSLIIYLPFS